MDSLPVHQISNRPTWRVSVSELWEYRHLVVLLAWRNVRVRYKQTILGLFWAVLGPVAFTAIFFTFFRIVSVQATGDLPLAPTIFCGLILWQFFSRALTDASTSLSSNANLITKVYFPRMVLPLAAIVASLADLVISLIFLAALFVWFGLPVTPKMLCAPVFILQTFVLVLGFGMWFAAIDGLFRDMRHAMPLLLQLGMLVSPVVYVTSLIPAKLKIIYELNPIVAPLEGFRWSMIAGAPAPDLGMLGKSLLIMVVLLVTGNIFFSRVERLVIDSI
jgi:lipopolysaccharide transport system permease protein